MKNLEIKVEVGNLNDIKTHLAFSTYKDTLEQVDTYFLLGDTKIKIREEKMANELIIYFRKMKKGSRESRYYRFSLNFLGYFVVESVLNSIFGVKVRVVKRRDLYLYKNTRIHIDTASGLGNFVELETVCKDPLCGKEYHDEHEEIKQKLSLGEYKTIAGSYSDMLWQKKLSHRF
ncbi:MAG: class IV adenylate cyclase [Patescibacteria group bacterium]